MEKVGLRAKVSRADACAAREQQRQQRRHLRRRVGRRRRRGALGAQLGEQRLVPRRRRLVRQRRSLASGGRLLWRLALALWRQLDQLRDLERAQRRLHPVRRRLVLLVLGRRLGRLLLLGGRRDEQRHWPAAGPLASTDPLGGQLGEGGRAEERVSRLGDGGRGRRRHVQRNACVRLEEAAQRRLRAGGGVVEGGGAAPVEGEGDGRDLQVNHHRHVLELLEMRGRVVPQLEPHLVLSGLELCLVDVVVAPAQQPLVRVEESPQLRLVPALVQLRRERREADRHAFARLLERELVREEVVVDRRLAADARVADADVAARSGGRDELRLERAARAAQRLERTLRLDRRPAEGV
mmetsp:Transcript_23959/g.78819  ORF Transcript_23959/g.78819 Transcript_23959/m.78819 type:complete len:352 (+) Transcript_23959:340-1395(+)